MSLDQGFFNKLLVYQHTELELSDITSGTIVTISMILIVRSSYISDLRNFILNQQNVDAQKQIADLNSELATRVRAFIPQVIANRMESAIDRDRRSVPEASVDVLQARPRNVACLFSDIRGYTQGSTDLERFISNSVLPEVKACSNAVEKYGGIPRKIGDLIFSYFDEDSIKLNIVRAILAGLEIARLNDDMNATTASVDIRRYILVSCGDAIVGNIGGLDSSIEITALGPHVNFLSRLDDATKEPALAKLLSRGDILISKDAVCEMGGLAESLGLVPINLLKLGVTIRDFPATSVVYRLRPSESDYTRALEIHETLREHANNGGQGHLTTA